MHGTGVISWLAASLLLAGCTLPTHHVARVTTPPPTLTVSPVPTVTTPAPVPSVDLRPQPVTYVKLAAFLHGPVVPDAVQRKKYVLLPGKRQLRLDVAAAGGPCATTLAASPQGRWLAFTAPAGDLQVIDLRGGNQYSLGLGCDPTWGAGGRLAYLVHGPYDSLGSYRSAIVVRETPLTSGKTWATGRLAPQAWAGQRLVYLSADKLGRTQPVIASRPGASHPVPVLATGPALGRFVVASPDGGRLLLQLDTLGQGGRPVARIALVDSRSLKVLSSVAAGGFEGLTAGVWDGNRVVASNGIEPGDSAHPPVGLIRFSTTGDHLSIQQVAVPTKHTDTLNEYISDFHDDLDGTVTATHHWDGGGVLLRCRISTLKCADVLALGAR